MKPNLELCTSTAAGLRLVGERARSLAWLGVLALAALTLACGGQESDAASADGESGGGAAADTSGAGAATGDVAVANIGTPCASNSDCAKFGLTCFVLNKSASTGICSRGCKTETDCGGGLAHCNAVQGALICTLPRYCDPCKSAQDCGPEAPLCVIDSEGAGYCTSACTVDHNTCAPGALCRRTGAKVTDFTCAPAGGTCNGNGSQCSPCKTDGDCSPGHVCFQADASAERYCARTCDANNSDSGGNNGCDAGYACVAYGGKGRCSKIVHGQPRPTCSAGARGFCDPCTENWQCASNRCATKNDKQFCVQATPCQKDQEAEDCPLGGVATFCVPSQQGAICAPPPAFNCHGYMACFSHPCGPGEVCDRGECKKN